MNIDLNILNTKNSIDVNEKVQFDENDLKKAGILKMEKVNVIGKITCPYDEYMIDLDIKGKMVLPSSLTLEPVDYPFSIKTEENLSEILENFKKNQKTIDILPIIWENILMEIPIKVVSKNEENIKAKGNGWELITDSEKEGNHSLAKLKDLL